jgi:hypothetical protein
MTPEIVKTVVLIAYVSFFVLSFAIKVQSLPVPVAKSRNGVLEVFLVIVGGTGLLLPILWLATSDLAFADYGAHLLHLTAGSLLYASGLWLLGRVAWNLGKYWSPTLQLKKNHRLVTKCGSTARFGDRTACYLAPRSGGGRTR